MRRDDLFIVKSSLYGEVQYNKTPRFFATARVTASPDSPSSAPESPPARARRRRLLDLIMSSACVLVVASQKVSPTLRIKILFSRLSSLALYHNNLPFTPYYAPSHRQFPALSLSLWPDSAPGSRSTALWSFWFDLGSTTTAIGSDVAKSIGLLFTRCRERF